MLPRIIAVDFDGCIVEDNYPAIGPIIQSTVGKIVAAQATGGKVILWTCRIGKKLDEALAFCKGRGISFDAVNENLPEVIEAFGGDSRKIFAHEYWDDRGREVPSRLNDEYQQARELFLRQAERYMREDVEMTEKIFEGVCGSIRLGNYVENVESGVRGKVTKLYKPTACPPQILVRTNDGRDYHAPASEWRLVELGKRASMCLVDDSKPTARLGALEKHQEYLESFACNHGLTFAEAAAQPMVQAHLECVTKLAEQELRRGLLRSATD